MHNKVYNLFLTSQKVYQTIDATRDLVYAVDWSFLPENKAFNVTCRFSSSDLSITNNCQGVIVWDILNSYSYTGSGQTSKQSNGVLAHLKIRAATTAQANSQIYVSPKNSNFFTIPTRPNNNLLRIRLVNADNFNNLLTTTLTSGISASPANYVLILSFEECD